MSSECTPDNLCRLFFDDYHANPLPFTEAMFA